MKECVRTADTRRHHADPDLAGDVRRLSHAYRCYRHGMSFFYGWPDAGEWANTWLPALLGPAIFIGVYSIDARIARWNIERKLEADDQET